MVRDCSMVTVLNQTSLELLKIDYNSTSYFLHVARCNGRRVLFAHGDDDKARNRSKGSHRTDVGPTSQVRRQTLNLKRLADLRVLRGQIISFAVTEISRRLVCGAAMSGYPGEPGLRK